jgi:predicted nuclease of restriction endonuclease-like RecB superfamily
MRAGGVPWEIGRSVSSAGVVSAIHARLPKDPMNKLERAFYEQWLVPGVAHGNIEFVVFDQIKLRLGTRCWYTPDFWVRTQRGQHVIYETKGFWRDDARVKIQTAAKQYAELLTFVAATRARASGAWTLIEIDAR